MVVVKINWKVRLKNKAFWVTMIPAVIVLIHAVANVFGYNLDLSNYGDKLIAVVEAVFVLLGILGIVIDPTTAGVKDSDRALTYNEPRE
ncbi:MAG: phage holin [Clostridia bacterium]|nr:phage holin [Clostridia bacterium]